MAPVPDFPLRKLRSSVRHHIPRAPTTASLFFFFLAQHQHACAARHRRVPPSPRRTVRSALSVPPTLLSSSPLTTNLLGAAVSYCSVQSHMKEPEEQALFTSANVHTSLEVVMPNFMGDTHGLRKQLLR